MRFERSVLRPGTLVLRCFAERHGDLWVVLCLDFSLGAQADSFELARAKLEAQIRDYLKDALAGEDAAYAGQLLLRRAPLRYWLKYWLYKGLARVSSNHNGQGAARRPFSEVLPLLPAAC